MKKLFDFLVWHFGLPMVAGWSLLLVFGFASSDDLPSCQNECAGICNTLKHDAITNLTALDEKLVSILEVAQFTMDMDLWSPAFDNLEKYTGDLSQIFVIYATDVENNTECYIGMEDQILKYPKNCRMVCITNTVVEQAYDMQTNRIYVTNQTVNCRLVCSTNEINLTWYCNGLTNLFYGADRYNELNEYFLAFTNDLALIVENTWNIQTNLQELTTQAIDTRDVAFARVNSLDCDDYCTRCSSNCNANVASNCVIECRLIDEDGIYREECSTNCYEGPAAPSQCCDFTWLEDLMDDLLDKINEMADSLDKLKDWLDKWDTFLGWVDYYSRRPPGDDWVRKYKISPIYSYTVDGDLVITNQLRAFDYKEVNESFGTLSGNYFYDSIQMAYEIFSEVNQANAILASLNTNLSMRLEEKEMDVEEATNKLESAFDGQVGESTNQFASALGSFTNVFEFGDYKSPKIQGVEETSVMPSTFTLTLPFDFHEQELGADIERRDFNIPVDDPAFVKFISLARSFFILFYWFVIVVFWLFVGRYMFKLVLKVFDLVCTYLPRWV